MKTLFAILLTVFVFEAIECQGFFGGGPPFGIGFGRDRPHGGDHHRGGHHRHNEYNIGTMIRKMGQLEGHVQRYLDRAINFAKASNSSNVEVLQELRDTDVPQFFVHILQKLHAVQNGTAPIFSGVSSGPIFSGLSTLPTVGVTINATIV